MKNYLKLLAPLAGLLLLASPLVRADDAPATTPPPAADQTTPPPADQAKPHHGHGGGPAAMMEHVAKKLDLTADQQTKWDAIATQEKAALQPVLDDSNLSRQDRRAKMMEINKSFGAQRRAVLTADQQTKFDELIAKMRERRKNAPKPDAPTN
jgi:Spy/CpxP family protein refolding chaperone